MNRGSLFPLRWEAVNKYSKKLHDRIVANFKYLDDDYWDDLKFSATSSRKGSNNRPHFDETEMGYLFPDGNTTREILYIVGQFPHTYAVGTNVRPHIHFIQEVTEQPTFKIDYRWHNNGAAPVVGFTTLAAIDFAFTWVSGDLVQIAKFPEIDGTGMGISSVFEARIYRDDDDVSGDVLYKEFDIHFINNGRGSYKEYEK